MPNVLPQHNARELRHKGPCGTRVRCWRQSCQSTWGAYATVEVLPDGRMLAHCHGEAYPNGDLLTRLVA